jgi:rubrerythrin
MTNLNQSEHILEPLRIALEMERRGKQLFAEAAAKVSGRHARQTFEFLMAEEDKHVERIVAFYESVERTGGSEAPVVDESEAARNLRAFNDRLARLKDELPASASDIEAYRFALAFETGAEDFYAQKMSETENPHVRRFYGWLIGEEEMHARLLESCLRFAEDPAGWFKDREIH